MPLLSSVSSLPAGSLVVWLPEQAAVPSNAQTDEGGNILYAEDGVTPLTTEG